MKWFVENLGEADVKKREPAGRFRIVLGKSGYVYDWLVANNNITWGT